MWMGPLVRVLDCLLVIIYTHEALSVKYPNSVPFLIEERPKRRFSVCCVKSYSFMLFPYSFKAFTYT